MKNTMTGNRALFKMRGIVVGAAQNVTCSDDFGLQDVDGLGNAESLELIPGKRTHTISGSKYFVSNKNLIQLGMIPKSDEWLTAPDFEVEIIDCISGATVELYTGCKFGSHSRQYGKHSVCGEDFQIRSLHKAQ